MKAASIALLILAALLVGQPAECGYYCPTFKCYGPCDGDCVCVTPPGTGSGGRCYGVERVAMLVAQGWQVVDSQ